MKFPISFKESGRFPKLPTNPSRSKLQWSLPGLSSCSDLQCLNTRQTPMVNNPKKKQKKLRFAAWKRQRSSANCSRSRNRQCGAEKTQLAAVGSSVPSICFPIGTWPTRLPPARKARCRVSTNSWPKQITLQIQIRTFSMVFCWTQIYKQWSGFQVSVCIDLKSTLLSKNVCSLEPGKFQSISFTHLVLAESSSMFTCPATSC